MHAWESIQKTLNYIEEHIGEEIQIEELADLAGLSLFYYQRLFAFKDTYGITPAQYRDKPVGLMNYDKPDLSLNYRMVDEGVPLIGEGLVLEYIYPAVGYSVSLITAMRRMGIRLIS